MADDAQRGVTFTLKANVDPSAKQIVDGWFGSISSSLDNLSSSITSATSATTQSIASAAANSQQSVAASTAAQSSQIQQFFDQTNQAAQAYLDSQAQRSAQQAEREQQLRDVSQMSLQELLDEQNASTRSAFEREQQIMNDALRDEEEAMRRYFEAVEALREKALVDVDSITEQEILAVHQLEKEAVDAANRRSTAESKFTNAQAAERRREVTERIRGIRETEAEAERAAADARRRNEQIGSSTSRIVSSISEGSEALMRFANGFQHLGLVGEKDLQKVQDALLRIQGVTGVFTGLIRMFRQASEGIDAFRRIVELTAAAQTAAAAATAVDTAATAANTQAHAANVAVRAAGEIPTTTSVVMGAARIGTAVAGAGEAVGIGAASASALTVFGAAVAAFTGMLFAAVSAIQVFKENLKFDFGGGAKEGSFTSNLALSSWNPFSRAFAQGQAFETDTPILKDLAKFIPSAAGMRTLGAGLIDFTGMLGLSTGPTAVEKQQLDRDRMEKARGEFRQRTLELQREAEREINQITNERSQIVAKQSVAENEMRSARLQSLKPEERRAELIKEIAGVESNNALSAEDRARKVISMQKERLAVEREISNEQSRAAKEQLRTLEEQANVKDREIEKARAEAMSAAERFGLMTEVEQQNLIDARQRFQAGAGNVDVEELRKLRGFSGAMDEQIAAEARRRAAAAGFGAFQGEDLRRIQQMEAERQQLEVRVKAQADVVARIDVDIEKTAKEINKQIDAQWRVVLQEMAAQISRQTLDIKKIEDALMQRFGR